MQVPINVKSSNNISKWQMGYNSVFKGLNSVLQTFNTPIMTNILFHISYKTCQRVYKRVGALPMNQTA
jgi:hypothetical protein